VIHRVPFLPACIDKKLEKHQATSDVPPFEGLV